MKYKLNTDKLIQALGDKLSECPICHQSSSYSVSDKIFQLTEYSPKVIDFGAKTSLMPLAALTCANCGNTILINALSTDLMIETEDETTEEK